ncbi:metallophosphoesterase [Naasia aerilata]|uniref:3',5'-cyclic adenosine monophosphate phosphodiesterase CpdA n=1 Tax=Naasia aerilata TaxID=1162966 RepID=A0ABN6XNB5_9MICO|nr:metallophosphoesterase [Naasia aerilata]BDZ46371.1 3',5'-cyclic adenosine monophosphate phosphodiesterase CpdA [Naasia aerilata]
MPTPAPEPTHVLAHLSDTHFLAGGAPLHGSVDTVEHLRRALQRLEEAEVAVDAIVHTGDIADLGELDAYQRVREIVEPVADRLGCPVIWVAGNHDQRGPLREGLFGAAPSTEPLDSVHDLGGLRVVAIDTSVPGAGHGDLDPEQVEWLREVLAQPAPHGTVLAMHHPPVPTTVRVLEPFQFRAVDALAEVLAGTDVRVILSGHLHYSVNGRVAGVPVSVAPATSYTVQVAAPHLGLTGVDADQALSLALLYPEQVVTALLPIDVAPAVVHLPDGYFDS